MDDVGSTGDCSLTWILVDPHGSASQSYYLMFLHGSTYLGDGGGAFANTSVTEVERSRVVVTYQWAKPNESAASPTGKSVVAYSYRDGQVHRDGALPPH